MKQNTNNLEITITRDGQVTNEFQPTIADAAVSHVQAAVGALSLQVRMAVYDVRYGTDYRTIRNNLVREKRNHEFEKSIGLVAINEKKI